MSKVTTFNTHEHERDVREMHALREEVHAPGERVFERTGHIADEVNVFGKKRVSRNSMKAKGDKLELTNGVALPWWNEFDLTTSMRENVEICFEELGMLYDLTEWLRQKWNLQMANSGVQDIGDTTPVFQMTEFESDNRIAKWLRLILSGKNGWDPTEDYDMGEAFGWIAVETDIYTYYKMKGYRFVIGDQQGRGSISSAALLHHLGHELPNGKAEMATRDITRALSERWHQYYLQVALNDQPATRNFATRYWEDAMGPGHVVLVPQATLLAETQISVVYLLENARVSQKEYIDFIMESTKAANKPVTREQAENIWAALQVAGIDIGAQTRLPNYAILPKPGSLFTHHRHAWPIDHANAHLNTIPTETDAPASSKAKRGKLDWKW